MMNTQQEERNIWTSFTENMNSVIYQIKDSEGRAEVADDFDFTSYWRKLEDMFKGVSHEATKLSLFYSKPPRPSTAECESLMKCMEKAVLGLLHVFSNLPRESGVTMRKRVQKAVHQLVEGVQTLAQTIASYEAGSQEQLQCTGIVWQESDQYTTLPKDNKNAVIKVIEENAAMVEDAHAELTEALNTDEDEDGLDEFLDINTNSAQNDHHWSNNDKNIVQYCLGLIKCSKSLLKKTKSAVSSNGDCRSADTNGQLDELADIVERLSPLVDELATCLYPPLQSQVVSDRATVVEMVNKEMLAFLKQSHVTSEDDQKWVEFLKKANKHNKNKLMAALNIT